MAAPDIPTTEEIRDRIISDIETNIGQATPLFAKAFNRVLATALSGVFTIIYKYGRWAIDQIFTVTQDEDSLQLKGEQYDIARKTATQAELTVSFTGDNGAAIPAGTQFRGNTNGLVYQTQALLSISGGVASGNVLCLTSGIAGNLTNGSVLTIISPLPGIDNQATVTTTVTEGENQESIEDYRARIQQREKLPPQGGSKADYIAWALEVSDITRAFSWGKRDVSTILAGYIEVYPITDNDTSRIPSAAKLTEVKNYIDDPTRAPLQAVEIGVFAMTEVTIDVDVTALSPDTAAVRTAFEENLETYLLEREPKQFENQIDVKNVVSRSGVEAIAINSGADSITLTIDAGSGVVESYTLEYDELALKGSVTFPP